MLLSNGTPTPGITKPALFGGFSDGRELRVGVIEPTCRGEEGREGREGGEGEEGREERGMDGRRVMGLEEAKEGREGREEGREGTLQWL